MTDPTHPVSDAELLTLTVAAMRENLRDVTARCFELAPRVTVHSLFEAAGAAAVDLLLAHPELQADVDAKVTETKWYIKMSTAGTKH